MHSLSLRANDLVGRRLVSCERAGASWAFSLEAGWRLNVECPWRLCSTSGVVVADEDDGQWFGRPEPVGAIDRVLKALGPATVVNVHIGSPVADLRLQFSSGHSLEVWCNSMGFENWLLRSNGVLVLVCAGGGRLHEG